MFQVTAEVRLWPSSASQLTSEVRRWRECMERASELLLVGKARDLYVEAGR